jgi:RNA polymerase sigma-70 factor (ECF subfamily)
MELEEHLFRREAGRMVSALTRIFGIQNLALAEDVVQDAFCRALETWRIRGMPENPGAWLMATAKNRALDVLRRERTARTFEPELSRFLQSEWTLAPAVAELFSENAVQDDILRMMFSCCHPRLGEEAQVALILNLLCGFSVDEIASAFMSGHSAIEKRITRGKKVLAESKKLFVVTSSDAFSARLPAVHRALYLLFNEGYHGASSEAAVRVDLCHEAIRLVKLLLENPQGRTPGTFALGALLCLGAARLPARLDASGNLSLFSQQDRSQWDASLVAEGEKYLNLSATGPDVSEYHVEAAIAWVHAAASSVEKTDWGEIITLYDTLLEIRSSPVVALNRAIAIGQRDGPARGLEELGDIVDRERLTEYPFYFAAIGEFEFRSGRYETAREQFGKALALARNPMEGRFLEGRIAACGHSRLAALSTRTTES